MALLYNIKVSFMFVNNFMFKNILFQLHWFMGITAGFILSIVGVTGAIYSYDQQILKWINHDSYVVQVENRPKLTPEQLYQHFKQQQPDIQINTISVSTNPEASSSVNIVKEGERRGYTMMVNPYTAEVLPEIKGRGFFAGVQTLHRWLTVGKIGDREIGKQIVAASTLMLIFFILSGLYLRFPKKHSFRQWFVVKRNLKGRNFLWDLHAVVGTWVVIFYLVMAVTGLTWSYSWWRAGFAQAIGVELKKPQAQQMQAKEKLPPLDDTQILSALNLTWNHAQTQLGREFSTITFNIPKQANGKVDFSYTDKIVQHERARNSVTFDYQQNQIVKHDIYEAKPLNEKIMSSLLPVHRGSFFGGIYQFFAMLASLAMPLFFITGWMLYIKRREQKILAEQAKQALSTPIQVTDGEKVDWFIVYATQSGTAEQLAWQTASSLQNAGQTINVKSMQQLTLEDLQQQNRILAIASTFGTGEAPDLAVNFVNGLMKQSPDLSHLQVAVLALGSKEYADTFCVFGHEVHKWFKQCGATSLFDTIEVDNVNADDIQRWNTTLAKVSQLNLGQIQLDKAFHDWTLSQRQALNPQTQSKLAFNIELSNADNLSWQAGDILEIQPENEQKRIDDFLLQHGADANEPTFDSTPLGIALRYRNLTGEIHEFKTADELLDQLPMLPMREYSIANIPQVETNTQMLRLVVRQQKDEHGQLGLGSGWLTAHCELGQTISAHIRTNNSFHLIDDERPIICIGNGTGIAGLMSLIHAREQRQHHENWLIFGERQQAHDYFYREQLENWQANGVLQRLDVAFSRDQAEKVYVQHKIRDNAELIKTWIERGAVIYVCGSIDGMATDVDNALHDVLGATVVDDLRQNQRYRRDVY